MKRGPLPVSCGACPLAGPDGNPVKPVTGIGSENPLFIVVAEGPGQSEVRLGQPLVGPSGQWVNKALAGVGVKREDVYLTNVTLCMPTRGKDKDKIVAKASECCRARLETELNDLPDVPILVLGAHANKAFLGEKFKITELAGTYHEPTVPNVGKRRIIPTIHPAHFLRGGGGEGDGGAHASDLGWWNFQYDVAKITRIANGKQEPFVNNILTEATNSKRAEALVAGIVRDIRRNGWLACDTETVGVPEGECTTCPNCDGHSALEATHAQLTAIGLSTADRAISVAWNILSPRSKEMICALASDPTIEWWFHNRLYDEIVLAQHGIKITGKIQCTLLAHHNAFPGLVHKLQRVVAQFYPVEAWKAEFRHGKDTIENLLRYNAKDVLGTARLRAPLQVCVKRTESERTYELDLCMAGVAARMQRWGIPIDLAVNKKLADHFVPKIEQLELALRSRVKDEQTVARFFDILAMEKAKKRRKTDSEDFLERHEQRLKEISEDWEDFNPNSSFEVIAFLKACGVPLFQVTKTGRTSTKREILEALAHNPVVRDLLDYRSADKLFGTFVAPMPHLVDNDGRIHPLWSVNKITGRWGSSPNVQNWSSGDDKKGIPNLRQQVVAPPGRILIGIDKEQLEARIIALLSGDPYLLKAFTDGLDIHSEFAKMAFPIFGSLAKDNPQRAILRHHTKTMEYGYMYRALPITVWKQSFVKNGFLDVPLKRIIEMFAIFRKMMPYVEKWHAQKYARVMQENVLREFVLGRARWFPTGQIDTTVVANFDVQAAGASIVNLGVQRFVQSLRDTKLKDVWTLIQGHDSLVVECWENDAESVAAVLEKAMTDEYTVSDRTMKFPCKLQIGKAWSDV